MPDRAPSLTLDELRLRRLRQHTVAVPGRTAIFELTGQGAVDCLQGLLTNDVSQPGPETVVHGALLTPKGMIVVDLWVLRLPSALVLVTPLEGREDAAEIFRKSFPPRLAKVTERTEEWTTVHLYGEETFAVLNRAELPVAPGEGQLVWAAEGDGDAVYITACPPAGAPFQALLLTPSLDAGTLLEVLQEAGAVIGDETDQEAARLLAGWPGLGAEIDEKTLPQEVRFDEIGSVSYTKGCYLGQE
ncbi:MAG: YgfZ/GcvT domain-containing protein, partial [Gemmatimonadales bacterium]